jgi:lipoprotein-anchoring transpeptidase ErfK/SrfK
MPRDVFEAQIALMRAAMCPGSIDGAYGSQTRAAIVAFQQQRGLRVTGQLDNTTRAALKLMQPPLVLYTVTADDFIQLRPAASGWIERSALDTLGYTSILETVAEKHCTHPNQIKRLNPAIDWLNVRTGTTVVVPSVERARPATRPALIVIHLTGRTLELFDSDSRLLAHFPCSIARRVEKRPTGRLEVIDAVANPNFTFNPEAFAESTEARRIGRKLIIQPGPNNPVGLAWITLDLPGYGIHGSPEPEQIGRTESHGCFRLANWNATYLRPLVFKGMPVQVEP